MPGYQDSRSCVDLSPMASLTQRANGSHPFHEGTTETNAWNERSQVQGTQEQDFPSLMQSYTHIHNKRKT